MAHPSVVAGKSALLLRSADRSAATVSALADRGAGTVLCPLIDFELPADTTALDAGLLRLLGGSYRWLVLTSITTVRALKQRAEALGLELVLPAGTKLAVVGDATARAAVAEGMSIDFMPHSDHSAAGMLADWQDLASPATAFMPQADLASGTLEAGLGSRGWEADVVVAYRTVDAPARPELRLTAVLNMPGNTAAAPPSAPVVDAAALIAAAGAPAGVDAVLFTSPSIVRRFLELVPVPAPGLLAIAIGRSTAGELRERGWPAAATAAYPTPEGLADAWEAAHATARNTG
ncbi:uroporphyrinogen-III synthase [Paeniglutamicibacter cryotolerans]|uniref:Uroporphyrinogen-III synthase n=1 Tax=Paeniglutamicibacter cryotolerans TaxID=670079 RepID=A0A839QP41_9MICC|nr:uroporphyrinogen-III synthase [Paeniglutamicibacter cryotolerans]MBB2996544.1 uroporphyrinogen-III synthase [Paeniglutamicibacter cryotolerans]